MESTFGQPRYRMPPRSETVARLLELVTDALADGRTPVIHAYPLGKSQEVTRLLTRAGVPVLQHPAIFAISQAYRECGVDLGDVRAYDAELVAGPRRDHAAAGRARFRLARAGAPVSIAVTGWAVDSSTKYRWGVDHALPLSDHADFDELLEAAERSAPRKSTASMARRSSSAICEPQASTPPGLPAAIRRGCSERDGSRLRQGVRRVAARQVGPGVQAFSH